MEQLDPFSFAGLGALWKWIFPNANLMWNAKQGRFFSVKVKFGSKEKEIAF